ncbi:hypothetical protein CEV33_0556 [Brucella grignonensis]|uniref:Uncharacterized protein n=1 Tax=Brucella grignonensis TaxID=94627 RepID=A0A256FG54_9HYPH|nr:hypothetical protein CEV33_0556 [Brucella grignonensis]
MNGRAHHKPAHKSSGTSAAAMEPAAPEAYNPGHLQRRNPPEKWHSRSTPSG